MSSYLCVFINAVASVVLHLHLRRRFYNKVSKIKQVLYIASWSVRPPSPSNEKLWLHHLIIKCNMFPSL
jgi:hypothetical protein